MQPKEELALKAATLSRVAPVEWQSFLKQLAVYNEVHRNNLVKSPIAELPVNQGRAQALSTLFDTLARSQEIADTIGKK